VKWTSAVCPVTVTLDHHLLRRVTPMISGGRFAATLQRRPLLIERVAGLRRVFGVSSM
jgi:hypothetical protein